MHTCKCVAQGILTWEYTHAINTQNQSQEIHQVHKGAHCGEMCPILIMVVASQLYVFVKTH